MMINSFGIKPVRGGSPASDIRRILSEMMASGFRLKREDNCELVEIVIRRMNIGIITIEYRIKYVSVMQGIGIVRAATIHPEWVIDEYASRVRR